MKSLPARGSCAKTWTIEDHRTVRGSVGSISQQNFAENFRLQVFYCEIGPTLPRTVLWPSIVQVFAQPILKHDR
jgi:hypothetical protein